MSDRRGNHTGTTGVRILLATLAVWGVSSVVPARAAPGSGEERAGSNFTVAAEAGWERLGEDSYLSSALKFGLTLPVPEVLCGDARAEASCETQFRAGLQAPLRLRLIDRSPSNAGTIRRADWDETSDYLRVVRYLEYGGAQTALSARVGELGSVTLGHGTIVNDYYNVVTPDQFRAGATARVDTPGGGGTALVNDVVRPALVGGRIHVRPGWFVAPESWWARIAVGASMVADLRAPTDLRRTPGDRLVVGPERLPRVESRRPTAIGGLDLAVHVLETDLVTLVPYGDFNAHLGLGHGLHSGVRTEFRIGSEAELTSRFEFRSLGDQYLPEYVGPLYEIDRYQLFGWNVLLPGPKLRVAAERRSGPVLGGYGELTGRFFDSVAVSAAYAGHEGRANSNFRLSVRANPIERVRVGAFYFKHNFDAFSELLERDGTFLVTETRIGVVGPLYAKGAFGLLWQLRDDGVYRPINRWNAGLGVSFGF